MNGKQHPRLNPRVLVDPNDCFLDLIPGTALDQRIDQLVVPVAHHALHESRGLDGADATAPRQTLPCSFEILTEITRPERALTCATNQACLFARTFELHGQKIKALSVKNAEVRALDHAVWVGSTEGTRNDTRNPAVRVGARIFAIRIRKCAIREVRKVSEFVLRVIVIPEQQASGRANSFTEIDQVGAKQRNEQSIAAVHDLLPLALRVCDRSFRVRDILEVRSCRKPPGSRPDAFAHAPLFSPSHLIERTECATARMVRLLEPRLGERADLGAENVSELQHVDKLPIRAHFPQGSIGR